jgi:hypothetical protein
MASIKKYRIRDIASLAALFLIVYYAIRFGGGGQSASARDLPLAQLPALPGTPQPDGATACCAGRCRR